MAYSEAEFLALVDKHKGIIYKVSRIYFDQIEDQEDLYQEILLQTWKAIDSFKGKSAFSSWLYRVALNTAIVYFKKDKPRKDKMQSGISYDRSDEDDDYERQEQVASFYRAVYKLDKIEKAIILMFIDRKSGAEIAETLGLSEGNVRVKISRTKNKLQELVKQDQDEL